MRRKFNVTGSCNPERHYMVDTAKRFDSIKEMIDAGEYFAINRARQYGKTTTLQTIRRKLSDRYLIIKTSFEGVGDQPFKAEGSFVKMFARLVQDELRRNIDGERYVSVWDGDKMNDFKDLAQTVSRFCSGFPHPVVVLIDEVDKSSDNQTFLGFIGMLRDLYLLREDNGMDSTFHSVILAGVYDVKNLKLKLRPNEERKYNSPWNIAADFNVDMTFHPEEIAQMLTDYENDMHTGMDVMLMGKEIYKYTSGYPYLVSAICKLIDERMDAQWNAENVQKAVKIIAKGENVTLLDDLSKNLENIPELREFLYSISVNGQEYTYALIDPMIKLADMFSYIKENQRGKTMIHNLIFEEALFVYFSNRYMREQGSRISPFVNSYIQNGHLNMEYVVTRFRDLMREEYRDSTTAFLEREGRLLFLTFLKPIINGVGFYYVEPQTRNNRRMDLVVNYEKQEFVVELKIWRGERYEEDGKRQLAEYLEIRGLSEGYLLTFDFSKDKSQAEPRWMVIAGKRIFEAVI